MKAVMLAMRYLTNAFGNIIDVAVIALLEGKLGSQVCFNKNKKRCASLFELIIRIFSKCTKCYDI